MNHCPFTWEQVSKVVIDRSRLEAIIREAGSLAMAAWPGHDEASDDTLEIWEKSPDNPVCSADLKVDAFLKAELSALLPSAGWLSEETADAPDRLDGSLIWLVDPIDGTRDYIRGRDGWAVSVALISAGRPLIGLLHAPARNEFWLGEAGRGSWRNGERLVASQRSEMQGARVPAWKLPHHDGDLVAVKQPNSIALRIAMVAADEADFVATMRWGFEWDIAAAALIAREAGAAVTDVFGQPLNYNKRDPRAFGVLASSPAIHGAVVERLAGIARETARATG